MKTRVFAALELPPAIKDQLAHLLDDFSAAVPPRTVRWVRRDSMHLTVKFYGEVPNEQLPRLWAALERVAAGASPVQANVEGLGLFPNARRPQVIWVGLTGDLQPLRELQTAVEAASAELGFEPDGREFTPHLTLGRVYNGLRPVDQQQLLEFLKGVQVARLGEFRATALTLMRSDLRPGGSVYTPLFTAPLGQPDEAAE